MGNGRETDGCVAANRRSGYNRYRHPNLVFDMNIATAVAAPRVHNQWMPDRTLVEPGISADTQQILEGWGHNLTPTRRTIGRSNSLMIGEGWMQGFADMRRPGGHVATE